MNKLLLILVFLHFVSCQDRSSDYPVEPGISETLAQQRKMQIGNVVYRLSFNIPDDKGDPINARLYLDVEILDKSRPLVLDFSPNHQAPINITIGNDTIPATFQNEHIVIPVGYLNIGNNTITIEFQAGNGSLNRNQDYMYTLVVPDRSREVYPCFDQPNIKAKYELTLTTPKEWNVLSATHPVESHESGSFVTHYFPESDPMSSYVFSFVAGLFNEITMGDNRVLFRETDSSKINASLPVIHKGHTQALQFMEAYTNYSFPFQKLDYVTIPGFQYSGMEHVGAIQYAQDLAMLDADAPLVRKLARAKTIAHEVAHMWFGNLVTMDWFNDVWLKEVFANFMADKIINPDFPEINHDLNFLITHVPQAYNVDRTKGSNPIRQNLLNLKDAGSLYGSIIYHKAPVMMKQLELMIGENQLKEGLQEYINKFAYDNATWDDLVDVLNERTEVDLVTWSDVWVNQASRAIFTSKVNYHNSRIESFILDQVAEDGTDKIWPQTFEIALVYQDSILRKDITVTGNSLEVHELKGLQQPIAIHFNSNGYGYGIFPIDTTTVSDAYKLEDEVIRAQTNINLYENMLAGNISVNNALKTFEKGIAHEENEIIAPLINRYLTTTFWTFLSPNDRLNWQQRLVDIYWNRLQENLGPSIKKPLFDSFSDIAYDSGSLDLLYRLWKGEIEITNLNLREDDKTTLAMKLALYEHPLTDHILEEALMQITNDDRRSRFEFIRPALSNDARVRREFFLSFGNAENRTKEKWVETACNYIHHPLRQQEAVTYLGLSLDLLEEVQKTGDIFFPKRWLDITIGQYQSEEAMQQLEQYWKEHPDLNPQLASKLLQSTDNLIRYQTIMK